jgi:hypothetical protein
VLISVQAVNSKHEAHAERILRLRGALYGGIGGSLGATVGWLLWIAVLAFQENWKEVTGSVLTGAAVGFIADLAENYLESAREEAAGPISHAERQRRKQHARHHSRKRARAAMLATALLFLGFAIEHLVSHVINVVLFPFLASVVGFFLPGAMFAYKCWHLPYKGGWDFDCIEGAVAAGLLSGIAAGVVFSVMNRAPSFLQALAWWFTFSISLALVYAATRPLLRKTLKYHLTDTFHATAPILAVPLLIGLMLTFSDPTNQQIIRESRDFPSLTAAVENMWVDVVNQMLASGDLPEAFWKRAEQGLNDQASPHQESDEVQSPWGTAIARRMGCIANGNNSSALNNGNTKPNGEEQNSQAVLCKEVERGFASGIVRSWFVLSTFALGLKWAYGTERKFRPVDYGEDSDTRRKDFSALNWITVAIVAFVLFVCWRGIH